MYDMLDDSVRLVSDKMNFCNFLFYRRIIDGGRVEAKVWLCLAIIRVTFAYPLES